MNSHSIDALMTLDIDELYFLLGSQVHPLEFGAGEEEPGHFGRKWFERNVETLRAAICRSPSVQGIFRAVDTDEALEVAAIVDAISAFLQVPVATTVAVIIVKRGLRGLCDGV